MPITHISVGPDGHQPSAESGWPSVDWATSTALGRITVQNGLPRQLQIAAKVSF